MKMLCKLVIVSGLVMTAAFPAMAQQGQQQTPMMGQERWAKWHDGPRRYDGPGRQWGHDGAGRA